MAVANTEEPASASQSVKRLPNATAERPTAHTLIALQTGQLPPFLEAPLRLFQVLP